MAAEKVLDYIDEALVLDLTSEMVRVQTVNPPGDELPLAEMLRDRISGCGIEVRLLSLGENRANLISRISGSGERPSMVLCGHLDTVPFGNEPWEHPPLSGIKVDDRIFGRGSSDMKGGVAAMVAAAVAIRRSGLRLRGDLVLAFTAGEEVDCLGARSMVEGRLLEGAGCLVIAEPSDMDVYIAQKGALWLEAITYGKAAHGSLPHQGRNAILPMADFVLKAVNALDPCVRHRHLGQPTINIGTIQGGLRTNIVPDCCRLTIDLRTLPGQDHQHLYGMFRELLEKSAKAACVESEFRIIASRSSVDTPADDPFVELFTEAARQVLGTKPDTGGAPYFTEAAFFVPALKVPMVICGPGEAALAHKANESVKIDNLYKAARTYALAAARFLGA
ncbi:MAG: M20 family metallopeptidase [Syntrophobacteraceae bacterium]|jgi:succinyl-diaminopimelate desuccinylase